jgi:hypothetical protein
MVGERIQSRTWPAPVVDLRSFEGVLGGDIDGLSGVDDEPLLIPELLDCLPGSLQFLGRETVETAGVESWKCVDTYNTNYNAMRNEWMNE